MSDGRKVIVIGSGACGLTAAYRLKQQGFDPVVLDRNDYTGGRTKTHQANGFTMDEGASLFPSSYVETFDLACELGLEDKIGPVVPRTAIYVDGKYHIFNLDHPVRSFLKAPYLSLASKLSLMRIAPALWRYWNRLKFSDLSEAAEIDTDSAEVFCRRRVSDEAYERVLNPLMRCMFGVNGDQISTTELLWIIKYFSSCKMLAFQGGMQTLAKALGPQLNILHGHAVERVDATGGGVRVSVATAQGLKVLDADYCVVATDGKDLQRVFGHGLTERQNRFLTDLIYFPLQMITFMTSTRPPLDDVFAVQIPAEVDPDICIFVHDHNFSPTRAPKGKGLISFVGMADWQFRMKDATDEDSINDVRKKAKKFLPFLEQAEEGVHIRRWPRGSTLGYPGVFKKLAAFVADVDPKSRVLYTGDYMSSSCVNTAVSTGNAVARRLVAAATLKRDRSAAAAFGAQAPIGSGN